MHPEKTERLFKEFQELFKRGQLIHGFECQDGWFELIRTLAGTISALPLKGALKNITILHSKKVRQQSLCTKVAGNSLCSATMLHSLPFPGRNRFITPPQTFLLNFCCFFHLLPGFTNFLAAISRIYPGKTSPHQFTVQSLIPDINNSYQSVIRIIVLWPNQYLVTINSFSNQCFCIT